MILKEDSEEIVRVKDGRVFILERGEKRDKSSSVYLHFPLRHGVVMVNITL